MVSLFDKSLGPEAFGNMTKEAHREEHCSRELRYLSRKAYLKKQPRLYSDSREPQTFSSFEDQSKYAGFVPSGAYFSDLLVKYLESMEDFYDSRAQALSSSVIRIYHSHKVNR